MINKKIGISLMSIAAALAMAGGAAYAAFSSTNTNSGNTFSSGTLTLLINTEGPISTGVFGMPNAIPGSSVDKKLTLKNSGNVPASSVNVGSIVVGGANTDLADKFTLTLFNDVNDDGIFDGGDTSLGSGHLSDPTWAGFVLPSVSLAGGAEYKLAAHLTFDADANDTYQGKSATFSISFVANQ